MRYSSWDTKWDNIFLTLGHFLPFIPLTTQKIKILKKWKNSQRFLHMSIINKNHMMYGSWDMEHNRQNFFSFCTIFFPFTPPPPSPPCFTQVYHKWQSYDIWFLRYQLQQTDFFVILGHFLPFYPPNILENENIKKMKKNTWRYRHFT